MPNGMEDYYAARQRDELQVFANPRGINQYTKGGGSPKLDAASVKDALSGAGTGHIVRQQKAGHITVSHAGKANAELGREALRKAGYRVTESGYTSTRLG